MPKRPHVPHHSAPCLHPTVSGLPCPNKARAHHPEFGPVCALHAHHTETSEGRTSTILVRLHPDERRAIEIAADTVGVSMSDLARDMLLGLDIPKPLRPAVDAQVHGELGRIGTNLNQIARSLNRLLAFDERHATAVTEIQDLKTQLHELGRVLRSLQSALGAS